jgi:multiple sugar transport system ATP-binding protein
LVEIRFEGVEKRFGSVTVIKKLDLTIKSREFFTFLGPSGCGKSTILNMIAGLEDVTRGTIYFDGVPVNGLSPAERDVAMVFQSYALYPHMTVYENIAFPLRVKKEKKERIDEEVKRIASLLDLESLLQRKPKELSGGQKQRVALGRAIVRKPKVFLMDEPLSNLDAKLRLDMRSELKKLHQELGITTVYVTHDQEEAMVLSDRMAVLYMGIIQQCDIPINVYKKPANVFVADFIGSPPMNFIDGSSFTDVEPIWSALRELDREVVIGIRPYDLIVSTREYDDKFMVLRGEVLMVEQTGNEIWVDGIFKGIKIRGRLIGEKNPFPGESVFFHVPFEKLHIFDKESGTRII